MIRLERTTLSGRRLAVAGALTVVVVAGLGVLAGSAERPLDLAVRDGGARTAGPPATPATPTERAPEAPNAAPTPPRDPAALVPVRTVTPRPSPSAAPTVQSGGGLDVVAADDPGSAAPAVDEVTLVVAQQVAADFAIAVASYRYDDPPDALASRVAPYATDELLAELEGSSGATAARRELAEREEVATAQVDTVVVDTATPEVIDLLVTLRQDVSSVSGTEARYPSYLVRAVPAGDGQWRVAGFTP